MDKEKEIMKFAGKFLHALLHKCLKECGGNLSAIQFPVFKKFLTCRVKRELEYYRHYLDKALVLHQAGVGLDDDDIEDLMEGSRDIDKCLSRDILLLPIRIKFDYEKILPLRKERAVKQVEIFLRMLDADGAKDYKEMVRMSFNREEFTDLNNEVLEIYAEENFIINTSLTSIIEVDSEEIANRMHCSMLDLGFRMNAEITGSIFDK